MRSLYFAEALEGDAQHLEVPLDESVVEADRLELVVDAYLLGKVTLAHLGNGVPVCGSILGEKVVEGRPGLVGI